ncbi:unnamed protein product [Scytosiphon promiscuus]
MAMAFALLFPKLDQRLVIGWRGIDRGRNLPRPRCQHFPDEDSVAPALWIVHLPSGSASCSFGVLCWETITNMEPWDGYGNTCIAVGNAVMKGKRLDIPQSISTGYSKLIEHCWKADLNSRPDFEDIEARLFSLRNGSLTVDVRWGVKRGRLLIAVAAFLLLLCMAVHAGRGWVSASCSLAQAAPHTGL